MKPKPLVINGWSLYTHPAFKEYMRKLAIAVRKIKERNPDSWERSNIVSLYKAISRSCLVEIPNDPANSRYRQGNTLGKAYKHWFRAKPASRHRLFFRYERKSNIIAYVWINGPKQLRAAGSKRDPYVVFAKLLERGEIPDSWDTLIKSCDSISEADPDWNQT
ncbi:MAG: type II toxin-antitoxin system YhaV family toxin [Cyanobacteria bacterium P01_D01_bin.105]